MDSKLNSDEISALQSLVQDVDRPGPEISDGEIPQRLFAFNLVARQSTGRPIITKAGQRAMFHHACIASLLALHRGEPRGLTNGVEKWLRSSGFIEGGSTELAIQVTSRGRLWLASFEDDPLVDIAELTAAHFAVRRACSEP